MRQGVLYSLLIAAFVAVGGAYLVYRTRSGQSDSSPARQVVADVRSPAGAAGSEPSASIAMAGPAPNPPEPQSQPQQSLSHGEKQRTEHESVATARTDELMDLAMSDDPAALKSIVAELNNGDPDIRRAAVEATIQYGDSNAIPWLEAAAQWAQTTDEKTEITEAIDFLKLPKLETRTEGSPVSKPKTVKNRK
jgi:HEAT repeats